MIDYKLGWPPNRARALQLPIYGLCAEQSLKGYLGRQQWTLGEAAYLAFKGPKRVVGLFTSPDERSQGPQRTRSSGWPTRSTRSAPVVFRRRPTMCIAARRARTRPCAGRTTSVTFEMRLPFEDEGGSTEPTLQRTV